MALVERRETRSGGDGRAGCRIESESDLRSRWRIAGVRLATPAPPSRAARGHQDPVIPWTHPVYTRSVPSTYPTASLAFGSVIQKFHGASN